MVAGGTEAVNGTPQFEQNRFPREFGAPQRGQATIADVRCLRHLGTRRTAANIFAETLMRCRRQRAASKDISRDRSEEHTSELQSRPHLVCRLLLEKKHLLSQIPIFPIISRFPR